ncbi:hypothetical protein Tco_0325182 [Tanacetum coccineum]
MKKPFILGTPFLKTAKAEIRFDKGIITLQSGKKKINFFKIPESLYRVEEGTENDIDLVAPTTTISRLTLEWEERIKLPQEKEIEFNQWRSKVINDERSALVNEGCEVSDEGGVTTWMAFRGNTRDLGSFGEETIRIKSLLDAVRITVSHVFVNTAQLELVLLVKI